MVQKEKDTIEFEGKKYRNTPTEIYTKVGRKSKAYYSLPEFRDSETLVWQINESKKRINVLDQCDRFDKQDKDWITQMAFAQFRIESNQKELKNRELK